MRTVEETPDEFDLGFGDGYPDTDEFLGKVDVTVIPLEVTKVNNVTPEVTSSDVNKAADVNTKVNHVQLNKPSQWMHGLKINKCIIPVQLDTGAGADILSKEDYMFLKQRPEMRPARVRLTDYNGRNIGVEGECIVTATVQNKPYKV